MPQYLFTRDKGFAEAQCEFDSPHDSWEEILRDCGWAAVTQEFPQSEPDFHCFSFSIYQQRGEHKWKNYYLVDVWTAYEGFAEIFCPTALDVMEFLNRHFSFIQHLSLLDKIASSITRIEEILCDGRTGIPAAQRFQDRENMLWRERQERRKAAEAKK